MRARAALQPRKKPSQERSRQTVDVILEATAYILVEGGYGALTTNRVAERAGVNIATLYQYFPNKETLFAELLRRHVAEARAASLAVLVEQRGGGLESTARASVEAALAAHRVAPALHRIFTEEAPRLGLGPIDAPADEEMAREGQTWIASAQGTIPDPELTLWMAKNAIHALIHLALVERPGAVDSPAFAEELTRLLVGYLRRP